MKKLLLLVLVLSVSLSGLMAKKIKLKFDFESKKTKWKPWGTQKVTSAQLKRMVVISKKNPKNGKGCLVVRDEVDNCSPYAVFKFPIDTSKTYTFKGWLRADKETKPLGCIFVQLTKKVGKRDKYITGRNYKKIKLTKKWQKFEWVIKFSSEKQKAADFLYLGIRSSLYKPFTARGEIYADDIEFFENN